VAVAGSRSIASLLFQTDPTDPFTYAVVGAFLLVVALVAGYLPARAVLRVDPTRALRTE
jgi:ABC-type lipoprotein release transport system permease subunit